MFNNLTIFSAFFGVFYFYKNPGDDNKKPKYISSSQPRRDVYYNIIYRCFYFSDRHGAVPR